MSRLQDFPSVTPTSSDNLLVVQSQGQGLASVGSTLGAKMDKTHPTGAGSLSINRKADTAIGNYSTAIGLNCEASANYSYAEGTNTIASGLRAHAEGQSTTAGGNSSHAENYGAIASGAYSHAGGLFTEANHRSQHTFGEYNLKDTNTAQPTARGTYIEIVGKGTSDSNRSNARTLDWSGNEVLAGGLKLHDNQNAATLIVSNDIAANGGTLDCSVFPDGSIIFLYRNVDETQGIYIKSSSRWNKVIPVLPLSYVSTNGYVITNNNTNYLLRSSVITV